MDKSNLRKLHQDLYIRICKDSNFSLPYDRVAAMVGEILGTSALIVWLNMPSIDVMISIANGIHPITKEI